MFSIEKSRELLKIAEVFFDTDEDGEDGEDGDKMPEQLLNLNDAFFWGCADAELVPDDELQKVAELFWRYGQCGIYYWVAERRKMDKAEFVDVNRFIEFVRHEEAIRAEEPSSSKRAYLKREYVLGT